MAVPIARRNLFFEKGRLILSVTGIAASLSLILILIGFRTGLYATVTAYLDNIGADLIIAQSGVKGFFSSDSSLPANLHEQVTQLTKAEEAGHILIADVIFSYQDSKTPVLLVGFQPEATLGSPWKLGAGRNLEADDEILLDSWLAQRNGIQLDDKISLLGMEYTVVGLTLETSSWMSPYIFISLNSAEKALGLPGMVSYHLVRLPAGNEPARVAENVNESISGVEALNPDVIADADKRILATIMDTPIIVMLFIGFIIGVVVMGLTAYTVITDQIREYGVMKAIGASPAYLVSLVVKETVYRSLMGFVVGTGMAYLTAALIMARWPQFNILIRPQDVVFGGVLTVAMTLIAALLPVQRLRQIDPLIVFKS